MRATTITKITLTLAAGLLAGALATPSARAGGIQVLVNFNGANGSLPNASLIDVKGVLYGTTGAGGTNGYGTIFSYDPTHGLQTLATFSGGSNGFAPGTLADVNGVFYGTTAAGGTQNYGTIFSYDPAHGLQTLASFTGQNGAGPAATLTDIRGVLYGSTVYGGSNFNSVWPSGLLPAGTIFSYDPTHGLQTIAAFQGTINYYYSYFPNGLFPMDGVTDVNGVLYGTTRGSPYGTTFSGAPLDGTIFSIDPTKGLQSLISFNGKQNGANPDAGLINVDGVLYGTTENGGPNNAGTIFSYDPMNGLQTLASFTVTNGVNPRTRLIDVNGVLYGTADGGANGAGVLFAYDPPAPSSAPEPASITLLGTGLLGLRLLRRRRRCGGLVRRSARRR